MAVFWIQNPWVRVNSVDLSDHVTEVAVETKADDVDVTASGASGKQHLAGLRDDKFTINMLSDFASAKVDQTLWPLFNGGSAFLVECAAAGTAISATNPKFSGTCVLLTYQPVSGKIGDAAMTSLDMPVNGFIARATT